MGQDWDGVTERRASSPQLEGIQSKLNSMDLKLQLAVASLESLRESKEKSDEMINNLISDHHAEIFGRVDQRGIKQRLSKVEEIEHKIDDHIIQDRWVFGFGFALILAILGFLFKR